MITITQVIAGKTFSQNVRISLNLKNVSTKNILQQIEDNTDFYFIYDASIVDVERKASIEAIDETITDILDVLFAGSNVEYKVNNRQIALTVGSFTPAISQQQKSFSGKVTDTSGVPLPGVSIVIKGTTQGTITDADGNYSFPNVQADATLIFSFIGMKTQEIFVEGKTKINIKMEEETVGLEEVVAIGYGTQKKVSLTGAITNINTEEIESIPTSNLSNTLAGRAPGVMITNNSGFVGAGSDILIRGKGTSNDTSPLYVIDGILTDKTAFDVLDPNEVESVSFLKDAASSSIYGSRAANGVVLVSTRKGKIQKPIFTYKGTYTLQRTTKPLQSFTSLEELQYANDAAVTLGNPEPNTDEIFEYFQDKSYELADYIWQNPFSQQHNLSVNGGSENLTYYMMVGYNKARGSYHNTDYSRYNFRSNVTADINKYLKVNLNLSGNQRVGDRFYWPYDDAESTTLQDFYRSTFNWSRLYPFYVDENGNPTTDRINGYPVATSGWHPVELVYNAGYRKTKYRTLNGIFRVDLKIPFVKGMSTSFMANYTADDYNGKNYIKHNKSYTFKQASATNKYIPGPIDETKMNTHNLGSSYEGIRENISFNSSYQLNWFLNYDRKFGKHSVSGMVVYEQQGAKGKDLNGRAMDLLSSNLDQIISASQSTDTRWFDGSEWETARASWIGRMHYEFGGKYIAEFSGRYDGSYIFDKGNRWGFFPSGSLAWRISEEDFFDVKNISNLKFRGSIGTAGNDNVDAFQFQNNYELGDSYVFGSTLATGIAAGTPPNPNITWEKSVNYDAGIDFGLFNNKLSGEFDYFYRYTYDILAERIRVIPATYGAELSSENYAKMNVRGLEFSLNYTNKIGELKYSIGGNIGWAKDKVQYIDEAEGIQEWRSSIGHPVDRIYGYQDYGIIRDQSTLDALPSGFTQFGRAPVLGAILFKDVRGEGRTDGADGKIDENDEMYLSDNAIPRINYGINLEGEWKGFSISLLFQGVGAYDKIVKTLNNSDGGVFQVGSRPYFELWVDHWSPDNTDAKYPRAADWGKQEFGYAPASFWIRNGAYLRLKNMNVAYTVPKRWTDKLLIGKLQVFFNGTNLFCISGFKETDPEQYALDSYPIMKSFTCGLNINF